MSSVHILHLIVCLVLLAVSRASGQSQHLGTPHIHASEETGRTACLTNAVFYQIYIRAFYDSDGDGIGDLRGVIQKLDYLEDLGIGGLWLMPLFRAPTDHKYFASDFFLVDPEYGTNDDLRQLVEAAHERGIAVIIDFMVNHTSRCHPWFHASTRAFEAQSAGRLPSGASTYLDYYTWAKDSNLRIESDETHRIDGTLDESRLKLWKEAGGITGNPVGQYYSRFVDAPDLNYSNPAVRQEIRKAGRFWLGRIGLDGFRLDAARHIFDCENAKVIDERDRNYVWWSEFCADMRRVRPGCLLIGEIWSNPRVMASYLQTGMDSVYDFALAERIRTSVLKGRDKGIVEAVRDMNRLCRAHREGCVGSTFLANHDFPRLMTLMKDDADKVRLAAAVLLTLPGRPFIYYGDELGLKAGEHLTWLAMPWDGAGRDPGQVRWTETTLHLNRDVRPVSRQSADRESLLSHFRKLIRLRNNSPALTYGSVRPIHTDNNRVLTFLRDKHDQSLLVAHNLSSQTQQCALPEDVRGYDRRIYPSARQVRIEGGNMVIEAYETVILGH